MTPFEPKVSPTGRYSIPETMKALGISRPTLLSYTKRGLIRNGVRKTNGRWFYVGNEIIRCWKSQ